MVRGRIHGPEKKSIIEQSIDNVFSIRWQYCDHFGLTVHSPEYLAATDYDIELWHHTRIANTKLHNLSEGLDPGDESISPKELADKYPGEVLFEKSKKFNSLNIQEQKELLFSAVTGKMSDKAREISEQAVTNFIIIRVSHYLNVLRGIGKYDEWIKLTIPYEKFTKLPIDEKKKYHNALVDYHDECLKELKGMPVVDPVSDSSPFPDNKQATGIPDFDNPEKWQKK